MNKYLLFAVLLCLSACISINDESARIATVELFDVELLLDDELIKHNNKAIRKEISYNGEVESSEIQNYDLTADFEILKGININNPNWSDKYRIDTLQTDPSKLIIQYLATDDKLPIRQLDITIINDKPIAFKAISERSALVADSKKLIDYNASSGYSITTETKSLTSEKRTVTVTISYNPS